MTCDGSRWLGSSLEVGLARGRRIVPGSNVARMALGRRWLVAEDREHLFFELKVGEVGKVSELEVGAKQQKQGLLHLRDTLRSVRKTSTEGRMGPEAPPLLLSCAEATACKFSTLKAAVEFDTAVAMLCTPRLNYRFEKF